MNRKKMRIITTSTSISRIIIIIGGLNPDWRREELMMLWTAMSIMVTRWTKKRNPKMI
jgi:hypothetical protein